MSYVVDVFDFSPFEGGGEIRDRDEDICPRRLNVLVKFLVVPVARQDLCLIWDSELVQNDLGFLCDFPVALRSHQNTDASCHRRPRITRDSVTTISTGTSN